MIKLIVKNPKNSELTDIEKLQDILQAIEKLKCVYRAYVIVMDEDDIQYSVNSNYYGDKALVLVVEYAWGCYAMPRKFLIKDILNKNLERIKDLVEI